MFRADDLHQDVKVHGHLHFFVCFSSALVEFYILGEVMAGHSQFSA